MAFRLALAIGLAVREAREEQGLTQARLAELAGVSRRRILDLEAGRADGMAMDKADRILKVLGLAVTVGADEGGPAGPSIQELHARRQQARSEAIARMLEASEKGAPW